MSFVDFIRWFIPQDTKDRWAKENEEAMQSLRERAALVGKRVVVREDGSFYLEEIL